MKKYVFILLLLITPLVLQAKYKFDETIFIPLEQSSEWKLGKQDVSKDGICVTQYVLAYENASNWSKLLTIHFKDHAHVKSETAREAMKQEHQMSPMATIELITNQPNDITYERTFPSGEREIVRMVMTKKGLHRAAYLKKGPLNDSERQFWVNRLQSGVIGS